MKQDTQLQEQSWYNYERIDSYNAMFNFILSNRGFGKTFGAKEKVIRKFLKKKEMFMYIRRNKTDLKDIASFFANKDLIDKFPGHKFEVKGTKFYCDGELFGYAMPLSISQRMKSSEYPTVTTMIFDEFISDDGYIRYLPHEVEIFLDLVETVVRSRDNVKCYFLANNITATNPYFLYFEVRPTRGERFTVCKNGEIVIEMITSKKFIENKMQTKFGKLISGTDYAKFSVENESLRDNEEFIERIPLKYCKPLMSIAYEGQIAMFWTCEKYDYIYCDNNYVKTATELSLSLEDHSEDSLLVTNGFLNEHIKSVIKYYQIGKVRFADQNVKHLVYSMFNRFGTK